MSISIHAPIVGCDGAVGRIGGITVYISIHAPIVGCDDFGEDKGNNRNHFNPRTHRGVRHS